jgi:hypothetical protein
MKGLEGNAPHAGLRSQVPASPRGDDGKRTEAIRVCIVERHPLAADQESARRVP